MMYAARLHGNEEMLRWPGGTGLLGGLVEAFGLTFGVCVNNFKRVASSLDTRRRRLERLSVGKPFSVSILRAMVWLRFTRMVAI